MTGDEGAWMWSIGLIAFSFGLAAGFAINYVLNLGNGRTRELEAELENLKAENSQYRADVSAHFQRTSELVQEMTQSYRSVYEHLATGSQKLCGEQIRTPLLDFPQQQALHHAADIKTPAHKSQGTRAEDDKEPVATKNDNAEDDDYLGDAPFVPNLDIPEDLSTPATKPANKPAE